MASKSRTGKISRATLCGPYKALVHHHSQLNVKRHGATARQSV